MEKTPTRYLRLLTYDDACKVIDHINDTDKEDYANITSGGVSMQVKEENWPRVEAFIKSLCVRYEVNDEHPEKTVGKIVEQLKSSGVISDTYKLPSECNIVMTGAYKKKHWKPVIYVN